VFFVSTDWNKQGYTSFVLYKTQAEFNSDGSVRGRSEARLYSGNGRRYGKRRCSRRNITNEKNLKGVIENYMAAVYNEPRTVGVSLNLNW
jgi:iron complex outermembrane receptor protein